MICFRFALPCAVLLFLASAGCDTDVDLYDGDDLTFSVFGYLDANADTQSVRVEPLRDSMFAGTPGFEARVVSENVQTGEITDWEQRADTPGGISVRNYYTTADFDPEATYRLRVERASDGAIATAEATTPPGFPKPEIVEGIPGGRIRNTRLRVEGIERLGVVRVDYSYSIRVVGLGGQSRCGGTRRSIAYHQADTTRVSPDTLFIDIAWVDDIVTNDNETLDDLLSYRVTVAAVSEDWPRAIESDGPDAGLLPPPSENTNVAGGTGYLGGAFTQVVDVPTDGYRGNTICS